MIATDAPLPGGGKPAATMREEVRCHRPPRLRSASMQPASLRPLTPPHGAVEEVNLAVADEGQDKPCDLGGEPAIVGDGDNAASEVLKNRFAPPVHLCEPGLRSIQLITYLRII
jgi:hypothetical protein